MISALSPRRKFLLLMLLCSAALIGIGVRISAASSQTVTCSASGCTGITGTLFNAVNLSPGSVVTETIKAINNYPESRQFSLLVHDTDFEATTPSLAEVMTIEITPEGSLTPLYGPVSLSKWQQDGMIPLTSIPAGSSTVYQLVARMNDVGNEYQSKNIKFDLTVGFQAVSASPGPTPSPTPDPGGTGGPSCSASAPTTAPTLELTALANQRVRLNWSTVAGATHYVIQYGPSDGNWLYGVPNTGLTTSYIVSDLPPGQRAYFQVAGVNDCAIGPWSPSRYRTVSGSVLGAITETVDRVLGLNTQSSNQSDPEANLTQVLGLKNSCEPVQWWWPIIIQILGGIIWLLLSRRGSLPLSVLGTILIGILAFVLHRLFGCGCNPVIWCRYLTLGLVLIALTQLILIRLIQRKSF